MEPVKCAGYVRVSTATQAEEGESLETQKLQIKDFIKQKGWELTEIYSDEGATGTKVEYRFQFQRMIKDAKAGKFKIVVFTKFSRFARNARDYQNHAYELKQYGVQLACVKENIDPTTRTGQMVAGMLALFAEWEHETIREQMSENKLKKWRENRTFLGKPPFGYRWNKVTQRLEIEQNEAALYKEIVKMYLNQGLAMRDIAIKLNAEGKLPKRIDTNGRELNHQPWKCQTISYMLKNPCYYGHYVLNQLKYTDGKKGAGTLRTKERKPVSESITFPIEPLISKPEWDRIQETTEKKKIQTKRLGEETTKFFLRHSLQCARCGARMNARIGSKRKDGTTTRYYICYYAGTSKKNLEQGKKGKCSLPYVPAQRIEKGVWTEIKMAFVLNPKRMFDKLFDKGEREKRIKELEAAESNFKTQLEGKERVKTVLKRQRENPELNIDELTKDLIENQNEILAIKGNLEEVHNQLLDLKIENDKEELAKQFLINNKEQFKSLRNQIQKLDYSDRMKLVESMISKPIKVDYVEPDENDTNFYNGALYLDYQLKYNPDILQRFKDEGKIKTSIDLFQYNL